MYSSEFLYSDHFLINISLDFKPHSKPSQHTVPYGYDYARGDIDGLVSYLLERGFDSCLNSVDIESSWHSFKNILLQACDKFIPKIKLRRHAYPKWFTKEICHQIKCIRTLRRKNKSRAQASTNKTLEYKILQLDAAIAKAKEAYENELIEQASSNPGPLFRHIRSLTKQDIIPHVMAYNDCTTSIDSEKASLFNEFFYSIYSNPSDAPPSILYSQ